jgi:putative glutamine amidotransferase
MTVSTSTSPLVGITAVPRDVTTGYGPDRADTASRGMVAGVLRAGGVPVVLPVIDDAVAPRQIRGLDALVFSGGQDLDAEIRGRARHPASTWIDTARDRHEGAILQAALANGTPILGICRGLQLVVDALGGRLHDHIDGHDSGSGDVRAGHPLAVSAGSGLARTLVGPDRTWVNSIHHQAVETLPDGLVCVARAPDGTLEAAEGHVGRSWFLGVQWHPELMLDQPGGQEVFDALVAQTRLASPSAARA